jgi:hypothetical protein
MSIKIVRNACGSLDINLKMTNTMIVVECYGCGFVSEYTSD